MKIRYLCFLMIFCITFAYGENMIINKTNITIEDIKFFLYHKESVLKNIRFIYTIRSVQPRYPEYNYKSVVVLGKWGNKLGGERIYKQDVSDEIYHSLYFFDGEKGYFWGPKTNSITLFSFTPVAMSKVGEYMAPLMEWTTSQTLVKTIEDDDNPETIKTYEKDGDFYVDFKCNLHAYDKDDMKKMDKSKWVAIDTNKIVFKCDYNLSKNIVTHREFYINEPLHYVRDVDEMVEISSGVYFPLKITEKSFEKNNKGDGFRVRAYGTIVFRNVALCEEENLVDAISFQIPRGANVYNNHTREISINGESYISNLPQEEIEALSVAKRLFGLSYQDLVKMFDEIE